MKWTLRFIRETDLARLYRDEADASRRQFWIPRSIVKHTSKMPGGLHIVDIPDWKVEDIEHDK